jgi:predicted site-specific integrase-resolvase
MSDNEVLLPAEAARRLGVRTLVIIEAMHEGRIPRVRMEDGTLGIPADALENFHPEVVADA